MERANKQLAAELEKAFAPISVSIGGKFFRTPVDWQCPCCRRSKQRIAYCKESKLICQIVLHHDHFEEAAKKKLRNMGIPSYAVIAGFARFPGTFVCEGCNLAEGCAKTLVKAPADFSFTPHEIGLFVTPKDNQPHAKPNGEMARRIYENSVPRNRGAGSEIPRVLRGALRRSETLSSLWWHNGRFAGRCAILL